MSNLNAIIKNKETSKSDILFRKKVCKNKKLKDNIYCFHHKKSEKFIKLKA